MVGACGLMAIDTSAAGFTVNEAEALSEPELMPIVVEPVSSEPARAAVSGELLVVATFPAGELQGPGCVRFGVVLSVYVPVAVNGCVVLSGIVADRGLV